MFESLLFVVFITMHPSFAQINPDVNEAIGNVRDDKSALAWVLAGFEGGDHKKQLVVLATGEGDIEELKDSLEVSALTAPTAPLSLGSLGILYSLR